jgi:hypothetical protein
MEFRFRVAYNNPVWRQQRNFNFKSRVWAADFAMQYSLQRNFLDEYGFTPYLTIGLGLAKPKTTTDFSQINKGYFNPLDNAIVGVPADLAHGPTKFTVNLPVGIGTNLWLSTQWSAMAEFNNKIGRSDYLDGVNQSGNTKLRDHYYSFTIRLVYKFNAGDPNLGCPKP